MNRYKDYINDNQFINAEQIKEFVLNKLKY